MENKHREYMNISLEIAFSRIGKTSPNPSVGAVIVRDGRIISTGGTLCCGSDHAEIVAIKNAGDDARGADMYVTLEPCCHYDKKTPPCTDAIINCGISRVFFPVSDPNPAVSCSGMKKLRDAGIEVTVLDEMSGMAFDLIRQFEKYIRGRKPFIIHKTAMTLDGRIAAPGGDSRWISSGHSRYIAHKLRSVADAIIIGKNTLAKDNPALTARPGSFSDDIKNYFKNTVFNISGRDNFFLKMLLKHDATEEAGSPLRIVIGAPEDINGSMNIFSDDNYLFFIDKKRTGAKAKKTAVKLADSGRAVFFKKTSRTEQVEEILAELYNRGIMLVLLEGGGGIAGSFFDSGAIDQFFYFLAPKIAGSGVSSIAGIGRESISDALVLNDMSYVMLGDDLLINGYSRPASPA